MIASRPDARSNTGTVVDRGGSYATLTSIAACAIAQVVLVVVVAKVSSRENTGSALPEPICVAPIAAEVDAELRLRALKHRWCPRELHATNRS